MLILLQNGFWLSECVHLSMDSSYSALLDDGVILEGIGMDSLGGISMQAAAHKNSLCSPRGSPAKNSTDERKAAVSNYVIDIQVMILYPLCSRVVVTFMHEQYYRNSSLHSMD